MRWNPFHLATVVLVACAACEPARPVFETPVTVLVDLDQGPIQVGAFGTLTGTGAALGLSARQGATLAFEEVNAAGGVRGRILCASTYDDRGEALSARRALERLEREESAVVVLSLAREEVLTAARAGVRVTPIVAPRFEDLASSALDSPEFRARFRARFKTEADGPAWLGHRAAHWIARALSRAESFSREDVDAALIASARSDPESRALGARVDGERAPLVRLAAAAR